MRVLVACEESQEVCKAFRALGHEAYSCDIEPCSGGRPEWHIQDDVLKWINGDALPISWRRFAPFRMFRTMDGEYHTAPKRWDMILAFPPCTYLSNTGAKHLFRGGRSQSRTLSEGTRGKRVFLEVPECGLPTRLRRKSGVQQNLRDAVAQPRGTAIYVRAPSPEENPPMAERIAAIGADQHRRPQMRVPRGRDMVHEGRKRPAEEQGQDLSGIGKGHGRTVGRYM